MCRFLQIKSTNPIRPTEILTKFAQMCRSSKTFDGDWQGDGWGITWLKKNSQGESIWQTNTSLNPVWEDGKTFSRIPESTLFLVHARSASFPNQKGILAYNQPFTSGEYAFVFNGLLKGVSLPRPIPGTIGAQKIWNLLKEYLASGSSPSEALMSVRTLLHSHSRYVQALNIGLSDGKSQYALTSYSAHPEYYNLRVFKSDKLSLVSSEILPGYNFTSLSPDSVWIV